MMMETDSSIVPCYLFANTNVKTEDDHAEGHPGIKDSEENNKMTSIHRRKSISIGEKLQILQAVDSKKMSKKDIAIKFEIRPSTLSTIIKNRHLIENVIRSGSVSPMRKKFRCSNHSELETALLQWYRYEMDKDVYMNTNMLTDKANDLANALGITFRANKSWVLRFKDRYGISFEKSKNNELMLPLPNDKEDCEITLSNSKNNAAESPEDKSNDLLESGSLVPGIDSTIMMTDTGTMYMYKGNSKTSDDTCQENNSLSYGQMTGILKTSGDQTDSRLISTNLKSPPRRFIHKRKAITLKTKLEVIKAVEEGTRTKSEIAKMYSLPSSTLSTILKDRFVIKKLTSSGFQSHFRMKCRSATYSDVDNALYNWLCESNRTQSISTLALIQKAKQLAHELGHFSFKANYSWVTRFKLRRGIISSRKKKKLLNKCLDKSSGLRNTSDCELLGRIIEQEENNEIAMNPGTGQPGDNVNSNMGQYDTNSHEYHNIEGSQRLGSPLQTPSSGWHIPHIKEEPADCIDETSYDVSDINGQEMNESEAPCYTSDSYHSVSAEIHQCIDGSRTNIGTCPTQTRYSQGGLARKPKYTHNSKGPVSSSQRTLSSRINSDTCRRYHSTGTSKSINQIPGQQGRDNDGNATELVHNEHLKAFGRNVLCDDVARQSDVHQNTIHTEMEHEILEILEKYRNKNAMSQSEEKNRSSVRNVISNIHDIRTYLEAIQDTPDKYFRNLLEIENFVKSKQENSV